MRAALYEGLTPDVVFVDDLVVEEPRADEVLVKVANCGICHSDLSLVDLMAGSGDVSVLGHEAAGTVEAIGESVTTLAVGDKVLLTPLAPCGNCYWCVRGEATACKDAQMFSSGVRPDGTTPLSRNGQPVKRGLGVAGFGEHTVVREAGAVKLDPDTPLDIACVIGCAIQTGVGAVLHSAKVDAGDTVLVTGLGGIGTAVVQGARIAGASKIVVSDPVAERRDAAIHFGATHAIDPTADDLQARVMELTNGIGVDYSFEAAGVSALVATCLESTRVGGAAVIVGVDATLASAEFMPAALVTHGKSIIGSLLGHCHPQRDIPKLVGMWRQGLLDLESMISHRFDLADANEGIKNVRAANGLRTVLTVSS